jgi:hypothetical protein
MKVFDMRILVLMLIGLLAAGNAAADRDRDRERGGYHGKQSYSELKRSWRKSARRYASARLNYLRASSLNAGVCDVLEDSSRSLRMMCIAFCELQSCTPDFTAKKPFENCSRSSKRIYNRYERKRGAGDPEMPCVQQPIAETAVAAAACPCWSGDELSGYLDRNPSDATSCTIDSNSGSQQNFDNVVVSGAGMLSMSSFGSLDGQPSCGLYDTCEDGNCPPMSRLMPISTAQALACEADVASVVLRRTGAACN